MWFKRPSYAHTRQWCGSAWCERNEKKYGKEKHVSLRGFGGACISLGVKGNLDWKKKLKTNVYILMGKKSIVKKWN